MLWGSFASTDTTNLLQGTGVMRQDDYADILNDNVNKSAAFLGLAQHWVFQQDVIPMNHRLHPRWVKSY